MIAIGVALVLIGLSGAARANDRETLALARICASESGIQTRTPDCAAILSVLRNRAERMRVTLYQAMQAYCPKSFRKTRTDHRRWIAHLSLDGRRPEGWPSRVVWDRDAWLELLGHAEQLLGDDSHYPTASHWGMKTGSDLKRARRAGWTRVRLDGALNAFWEAR
jgi:hypothetical protein